MIVRPFNTFGPRQSTRAVIPSIILQALNKDKIYLGKTDTTRDFTYVTDTANAFLRAIKTPAAFNGQVINLGIGEDFSINDIIKMVAKYLQKKIIVKEDKVRFRPKKSEVLKLLSKNTKAKKILKWKPTFVGKKGFEAALIKTIQWFEEYNNDKSSSSKYNY